MVLPTEARERRLKIELLSYFKAGHSIAMLGADAGKFSDFDRRRATTRRPGPARFGLHQEGARPDPRRTVYLHHRGRPGHPRRAFGDGDLAPCNCCRDYRPRTTRED